MSNLFGKAKFGGNKRNWFKLKDGDSVFRILPPMGDLADEGRWAQWYGIHYGYKNSKGETRTFQSPLVKNNKTKMVEVPDAALERIQQLEAKLKQAKEDKNEELVKQLLTLVGGQKSRYNLDNNFYMNVMDLQGNIGILKIRYKCKLALDNEIKRLRDRGVEPLDPENGRYFVFNRSGSARDTIYSVSVYKQNLTVEGVGEVQKEVTSTLSEDVVKRCLALKDGKFVYKEAANLAALFKKPTSDEVRRIVQEGEKAVDEILDGKGEVEVSDDSGPEEDEVKVEVKTETKAVEQLQKSTPAPEVVQAAPVQKTEAPKTTAQVVASQTEEEFLKSIGINV